MVLTQTVNGSEVTVDVDVTTDEAISGQKMLRIVVMEYYIAYSTAPGSNGETEFFWNARKMLPHETGEIVELAAGESHKYTQNFTLSSDWDKKMVYIVAFIQDDDNNEILQGVANNPPEISVDVSIANPLARIDANSSITREVTFTNPSSKAVDITVSIDPDNTASYEGWTSSITPLQAKIPAKSSIKGTLTINSPDDAAMYYTTVKVVPSGDGVAITKIASMYALHNSAKYAFINGSSDFGAYAYLAMKNNATYASKAVLFPANTAFFNAYPIDQIFDLAVFADDYYTRGAFSHSTQFINPMMNMLEEGKGVLISSELDLYLVNNDADAIALSKAFFTNSLGIVNNGLYTERYSGSTLSQYKVTGIKNEIANGIAATCNTSTSNYALYSDNIKLSTGSTAVPFMYYDATTTKYAAVRNIVDGDTPGKVIYCGFSPGSIGDATVRNNLYYKMFEWLLVPAPVGKKLAITPSSKNFGSIAVGSSSSYTFTISSEGSDPVKITEINKTWDDMNVYSISHPTLPVTLPVGSSIQMIVTFTPKEQEDYTANVTVVSDAKNGDLSVMLDGSGKSTAGPVISTDADNSKHEFGKVYVGESSEWDMRISNTGSSNLTIASIEFQLNPNGIFEITEGGIESALTLAAGAFHDITVKFTPKTIGATYQNNIEIVSNATNNNDMFIAISGEGDEKVSVDEMYFTNGSIKLEANPNPMTSNGTIKYTVNSQTPQMLEMYIIDMSGRKVQSITNSNVTTGVYQYELNTGNFSSGTYYVLANIAGKTAKLPIVIVK